MYDERSHPLLVQVPLTVSPFVSLPTATTLPYTYKSLPSTLPPSSVPDQSANAGSEKPAFIISAGGQAAHPDDIIKSCQSLQNHLSSLREDAEKELEKWQVSIKERELAEKRRVAPGWLDREEKILQPEKTTRPQSTQAPPNLMDDQESESAPDADSSSKSMRSQAEGEELDRAFGKLDVQ